MRTLVAIWNPKRIEYEIFIETGYTVRYMFTVHESDFEIFKTIINANLKVVQNETTT